ncbi:MAG: AAA family ATPase [Candidatus Ratteibacteria bacterium]
MKCKLIEMTLKEVRDFGKVEICILPWGSCEPHNLHLPYGTDYLTTEKIAEISCKKANERGGKVIVLPGIPIGVNSNLFGFPLTLHFSPTTQLSILKDIVYSLENHKIYKLVIINGHGGNEFKGLLREIYGKTSIYIFLVDWWKVGEDVITKICEDKTGEHGDESETSWMMYLFPELVHLEWADEGKVNEPKIKGLKEKYESHHKLKISDEAIEAAAKLSDRFIADRFLPDKAIDLIDEAASQKRLKLFKEPKEITNLQQEIDMLEKEKEKAMKTQNYELLTSIRDKERELKNRIDFLRENLMELISDEEKTLTKENIAEIVSQWTGIPVSQLCKEEKEKLLEMEKFLHKVVVGQDEAIEIISKAIRRSRAGLKDIRKPIGSFLFLGPTGVGKTLLARALAEFLFGDEDALIQIDMSEYMEKFSISRLIGAPPGYVGYEEGGQLTEKVRRRPYSVILFDEIEKAHPDVFNLLLQILEDGRLTDSFGRSVSFKNTVIIMTSNIGTEILKNKSVIGFLTPEEKNSFENLKNEIIEKVKKTFRPEFLNRLDDTIIFHPLTQEHLLKIVEIEIDKVKERLKELKVKLIVSEEAKKFLVEKGTNPEFGARPLKRTISRYIEDPLSEEILRGNFNEGDDIIVERKGVSLVFLKKEGEPIETKKNPVSISNP